MIVYNSTKQGFLDDIFTNDIDNIIHKAFQKKVKRSVGSSEVASWKDSMKYMESILFDAEIPHDCGVSIEFQIPQTNNRIDFILTGQDDLNKDHAIIIELKRWSSSELTSKDAIVKTVLKGGLHETNHPSYQAWSYAALLQGFSETVYNENIQLRPCAYLHNYTDDGIISNEFYKGYIDKAPLFLKPDALKLRDFIKKFVKFGDKSKIMYRIDAGRIKPSKALADCMVGMLKGNQEFILIDEQKQIYETALMLARISSVSNKHVLIVEGGPGTGKSVVAINLLVQLSKLGLNTQYLSKNAAPRAVYHSKLTKSFKKSEISNMFKGSGSYHDIERNTFDVLIADEAHRLNEKSGLFKNLGHNQVKEILRAATFSVFFLDEDQRVTLDDIGSRDEIVKWARKEDITVHETQLTSQFRCNGSDGYLAWLDNILQIKETANYDFDDHEFEFKIFDDPNELRKKIFEKNIINNKARMVAGYCWDWVSKKDPELFDINIPEFNFSAKWNLDTDGSLWIVSPTSANEVGCIHTCQGLEVDYIGVFVGDDLIVRNGKVLTRPGKRSKMDSSIRGYKKLIEKDPVNGAVKVDEIIKNTYRTLMTRGMRGCYVYFTDKETQDYFMEKIQ